MTLRAFTVIVHDLNDVGHSLDVTAATLYEAVAQALAELRGHEWVGEIGRGLTTVTVKVRQPEVTHVVKIQDFENGLRRRGKTPAEIVLKSRLPPASWYAGTLAGPHRSRGSARNGTNRTLTMVWPKTGSDLATAMH